MPGSLPQFGPGVKGLAPIRTRHGDTEERLHVPAAWHESPAFTDRKRAALALTDSLTDIADGHVPDEVKKLFSEKELACLIAAAVAIDGWNRIAVASRFLPDAKKA